MTWMNGDSYEYECDVPAVQVLWGLRETFLSPLGAECRTTTHPVSSDPFGVEKKIAEIIQTVDVVAIAGTMWQRVVRLRDGSRVVFHIILEVTDWRCLDCATDMRALDEYYLLHDHIWQAAVPEITGHLCIGCLEQRLERRVIPTDFVKASLNGRFTDRLRDRTGVTQ